MQNTEWRCVLVAAAADWCSLYLSAKSKPAGLKNVLAPSYNAPQQDTTVSLPTLPTGAHQSANRLTMELDRSTRVALLSHGCSHRNKVQQIVNHIADETVAVDLSSFDESLCEAVADCDLIVVEAAGHSTPQQQRALQWIRVSSLAPVVILTNRLQTDHTVDTITAGADAVIPLDLAHDAIVAHCRALMRRWRDHPYATPKFA